ncbi:hypothetical protein B0A53_05348 [Rhodotorula sp. CCFEE 5036]|nr:hypothetical protein B0A53_05348 [Rhodotorula sp. CCFEE 5036]
MTQAGVRPYRVTVLISGSGSNLQALLDATSAADRLLADCKVTAVISSRSDAYGLTRARSTKPTPTPAEAFPLLRWKKLPGNEQKSRQDWEHQLAQKIVDTRPDVVVLAGWMLILGPDFLRQLVRNWDERDEATTTTTTDDNETPCVDPTGERVGAGLATPGHSPYTTTAESLLRGSPIPIINLHPALPGQFPGAHAIKDAYESYLAGKITSTGLMIHRVIPELDAGEPVIVREVPIREGDSLEQLEQRIHEVEHEAIVHAVRKVVDLCRTALKKYLSSSSPSSSSSSPSDSGESSSVVVTETVNLSGGGIATITVTESGGSAPSSSSPPASSPASGKPGGGGKKEEGALVLPGASRNNIGIGFLPDYKTQTMAGLTKGLGIKSSFYGWYAQLPKSGAWDGAQLLSQMDDIKACKCIFQPAVMPTNGWAGLTASDDSQAKAIAAVMKKFTDEGIEVWLRFAHEVNWYTTDGTYQGGVEDFKAAWTVVAKAVADNDKVKMFYTPNVAGSLNDYVHWYPDDPASVDYLGIGKQRALPPYLGIASESFLEHVQPLYDKYCKDGSTLFAMGETGTGWEATIEERIAWLDQLTSAETAKAMPHYVGIAWFNYDKEQEFRLWIEGDDKVNGAMKDWLQKSNIKASGATAGNA